ncbi:MAG: hypothetical protein ACLUD2_09455 [Clostridium sp.]
MPRNSTYLRLRGKRGIIELWKGVNKHHEKESALQIIETRIKDLEILLDSASRNPAMKEKAVGMCGLQSTN